MKRSENEVSNRRRGNSIFIGRVAGNDRTRSMLAGIRTLVDVIPRTQLLLCTQARVYTQIRTWSACRVSREPRPVYNFPNIVRSGKTPWKCFVSGPRSHLGTRVPMDTPSLRWRDFYSIEIEPQAFHRVSNSAVIKGGVFSIKFRRVDEQLVN